MCICFNDALHQWTSPEAIETREALLRAWGAALRQVAETVAASDGKTDGAPGACAERMPTGTAALPRPVLEVQE
jgi:hypothetical protein